MLKKFILFFIFIIFFLLSFFSENKIKAANPEDLVCPGLKMFKSWCAGEHFENDLKACLMVSKPIAEKGKYKRRGNTTATIYHLPENDSQSVFYITAGYIYKNDSFVTISVDKKDIFELKLIENDAAWTDDDSIDKDIIKSMKKGNKMAVVGYSARGTKTTDIYSLVGFTAAFDYISNICDITN